MLTFSKYGIYYICFTCNFSANTKFDLRANMIEARQIWYLRQICYTCKSNISCSKFDHLPHLYYNRIAFANVQFIFTSAKVYQHSVNTVFTIFTSHVILVQTQSLTCVQIWSKLGKYDICGIFTTRVNPTSRVANLIIYLTFTTTEKLPQMCNLSLHLPKYINIQ